MQTDLVSHRDSTSGTSHTRQADSTFPLRFVGYVALALVFAAICFFLSQWQFARRDSAVSEMQRVERNFDVTPRPLGDVLDAPSSYSSQLEWIPTFATGHYVSDCSALVRNRVRDGEVGFSSLYCFERADNSVLLINRGWFGSTTSGLPPENIPSPSDETQQVTFRLRTMERTIAGQEAVGNLIPSISPSFFLNVSPHVITQYYGDLVAESVPEGHGELEQKPQLTEGNHLSYAFQWIAFGLLGFVGVVWIIRHEKRLARESSPEGRSRRPRGRNLSAQPRPRDSDARAEDSEIDEMTSTPGR